MFGVGPDYDSPTPLGGTSGRARGVVVFAFRRRATALRGHPAAGGRAIVAGMEILRLAAFPLDGEGGNKAGVVVDATGLTSEEQLRIAQEIGYAETAFLIPAADRRYGARYFSEVAEIPFCGHATVASAVALAERHGLGPFTFDTGVGDVVIETTDDDGTVLATFTSVTPESRPLDDDVADELLGLLGLDRDDLDPGLPLLESYAGNWHPIVALRDGDTFDRFTFAPAALRALMDRQGWTGTVTVVFRRRPWLFEARNLFASGTFAEDPATGSAAAALGGYLRAIGDDTERFDIHQGSHVGSPSLLHVTVPPAGGIRVTGTAIAVADPSTTS